VGHRSGRGRGSRIQPLAFSKELLPVGSRGFGSMERPCAVSEYLVERMILAGASKLAFVIGPGKFDILSYYGAGYEAAMVAYVMQPSPMGLCDAIFRAAPLIGDEPVLVGLPDTIWFPKGGFAFPTTSSPFFCFRSSGRCCSTKHSRQRLCRGRRRGRRRARR
jgi:glucose-1-phosphate thymidylyltransferase